MKNKLKFTLMATLFCMDVEADNLCAIDHIEKINAGLLVVFVKDMHPYVQGIKRAGSQVIEPVKENSPLVLKEGDESGIHSGPHELCVLKAERRENKLGILAVDNNHIPGMPEQIESKFILPVR